MDEPRWTIVHRKNTTTAGKSSLARDDQFKADFSNGGLDGITIIEPHLLFERTLIFRSWLTKPINWQWNSGLAEMDAKGDDEDGY
jgi:hypothetical protein